MKKLIETIVRALVDEPDSVSTTEVSGAHTLIIELKVAKIDIGKVIGKKGRTAEALRTILSAASAKEKKRTVLEIVDQLGYTKVAGYLNGSDSPHCCIREFSREYLKIAEKWFDTSKYIITSNTVFEGKIII